MITITAIDAGNRLPSLLRHVAAGEEVVITEGGQPVARLIAARQARPDRAAQAFAELRRLRRNTKLNGLDWRELRDAGRR